ncbi:c-type cytochrome [Magnetovibrio blakemorei]|uniref:Cytochrome c domain-containing protein n=1 Tax=Magnetovibrio blakemorei TaxID=28181 RepID=A0A1E5QBF3_9PROT|nr:cytochrome c [Magnetovibrio blakemorei]OEJ69360.1 hypothetical protein BEN30_03680 [Magnetovibrio blakemorei]
MPKHLILIVLSIALLTAGISVAVYDGNSPAEDHTGGKAQVVIPNFSPTEQHGKTLFETHCAQCHGINAIGTDKGPPFLHRVYHPGHHADGAFFLAVRRGVRSHHWPFGDMPAQPQINDSDISAIVTYVRALQRANGFAP